MNLQKYINFIKNNPKGFVQKYGFKGINSVEISTFYDSFGLNLVKTIFKNKEEANGKGYIILSEGAFISDVKELKLNLLK